MNVNAQEVNQTFDLVSYVSGLTQLHKSGAYWISKNGCPLCGKGDDHFQIKRFHDSYMWMSRKCYTDTKYHSVIDFLMAYHKETFKEALKRAGGNTEAPRRETGTGKPVLPPAPVQVLPDADWQAQAWQAIDEANNNLINGDEFGSLYTRQYLADRGISKGSIYLNLLGYDPQKFDGITRTKRPAIVIPWMDLGDVVCAIKYRYIDDLAQTDKSKRFSMMAGSMPYLFGLQHILNSDETLLFCEGELNAISVLQTLPRGVSVISAGSEGNGNSALLRTLARHYKRVVIWTDDPAKGKTIRERMNRPEARLLKSPVIEGVKYDANQMLQAGLLLDFVSGELKTVCNGHPYTPAELARVEQIIIS
jgi:hypothetical protein